MYDRSYLHKSAHLQLASKPMTVTSLRTIFTLHTDQLMLTSDNLPLSNH